MAAGCRRRGGRQLCDAGQAEEAEMERGCPAEPPCPCPSDTGTTRMPMTRPTEESRRPWRNPPGRACYLDTNPSRSIPSGRCICLTNYSCMQNSENHKWRQEPHDSFGFIHATANETLGYNWARRRGLRLRSCGLRRIAAAGRGRRTVSSRRWLYFCAGNWSNTASRGRQFSPARCNYLHAGGKSNENRLSSVINRFIVTHNTTLNREKYIPVGSTKVVALNRLGLLLSHNPIFRPSWQLLPGSMPRGGQLGRQPQQV